MIVLRLTILLTRLLAHEYIRLKIANDHIVDGCFGHRDTPIPIPEPIIVLSFVVLSILVMLVAVYAKK